jgi:hypothetical protein
MAVERQENQEMSGVLLAGNILKNFTLHTGTPFPSVNLYQYDLVKKALGANLDNPATTWPGQSFEVHFSGHEDLAGNFPHLFIALFSIGALAALWKQGRSRATFWYALSVLLGAVLYCWLLRWQIHASRLHTPLFALAAPLLALTISARYGRIQPRNLICALLVLYSLPFVFGNPTRSLVSLEWLKRSRERLYFPGDTPAFSDFQSVVSALDDAEGKEVGLFLPGQRREYAIWVMSGCAGRKCPYKFRSVGVTGISGILQTEEPLPPYVVANAPLEEWAHAAEYSALYRSKTKGVFRKLDVSE